VNRIKNLLTLKIKAKRKSELEKLRKDRGHITLEGDDLKLVLEGSDDENPNCCICMDGCVISEDENTSGV